MGESSERRKRIAKPPEDRGERKKCKLNHLRLRLFTRLNRWLGLHYLAQPFVIRRARASSFSEWKGSWLFVLLTM